MNQPKTIRHPFRVHQDLNCELSDRMGVIRHIPSNLIGFIVLVVYQEAPQEEEKESDLDKRMRLIQETMPQYKIREDRRACHYSSKKMVG